MQLRTTTTVLLMAAMLVACATDPISDDVTATEAGTDTEAVADDGEEAADGGDAPADADDVDDVEVGADEVEIPVWIAFTDERLDWARDRAAEFNDRHDGYVVSVQGYDSYEVLFDATSAAAQQGNPPAIVQYFEAATQEARDAVTADGEPLFASVEAAIDGRDEILGEPVVLGDVIDAVAAYYTTDGEFTSMPWNTSSTVMFNNMDVLTEAGIDEPPLTWDEVEAACEAIADLDGGPGACITWPNHGWFFEQSIGQEGELLANNDNGRSGRATEILLDNAGMLSYVTWWKELADAGHYIYTGVQRDWGGVYDAFVAQEVAMVVYSSSDVTAVGNDAADSGFEVVASFMPRNGDVTYDGNLIGGATLWLSANLDADVEEGALAFLQYFNNPENAADWHRTTGYVPITNASVDLLEDEGWFDEQPNQRVAGDQLAEASGSPASTGVLVGSFVGIRDIVTEAMEEVLVNDVDPADRFAQAQEEAQAQLDQYNSIFGD